MTFVVSLTQCTFDNQYHPSIHSLVLLKVSKVIQFLLSLDELDFQTIDSMKYEIKREFDDHWTR